MHCLIFLLCLLSQVKQINEDVLLRSDLQRTDEKLTAIDGVDMNVMDVALVFLCFIMATLTCKRKKINKRLMKGLEELKIKCRQQDVIVSSLLEFLEDSRSRNFRLEMPLRKLNRNIEHMEKEILKKISELENLHYEFKQFKENWNIQASSYINFPEKDLLANMESIKVKAELVVLREYVESELKTVKSIVKYNKSLMEEAEDDIDRLLVAEGL